MDVDIESLRSSSSGGFGAGSAVSQGSGSMKTFDEVYVNAVTDMELGNIAREEGTNNGQIPMDHSKILQREQSDEEPHKPDPPERSPSQLPETDNTHHEVSQTVVQFKNNLIPVQVYESSLPQVVVATNQATHANRSYSSTTPSDLEVPERVEGPRVQDAGGLGNNSWSGAGSSIQRGFGGYPSEEYEDSCSCQGNGSRWKILLAVVAFLLISVAIVVPVVLFAIPSNSDGNPVVGSAEKSSTDGLNPDLESSAGNNSQVEPKESVPGYPETEDDPSQNTAQIDSIENFTNQIVPVDSNHSYTNETATIEDQDLTNSTTPSRETLFVKVLESSVLQRNATFGDMDSDDPRYLALDWILNQDEMSVDADDKRLNQRYVLALLAFAFDYQAWKPIGENVESIVDGDNWLSSSDVCLWYNVTCEENVIRYLYLDFYSLIGTIPAEISQLISLEHVSFMGNCIYGSIPPEIGQLTNLKFLDLSNNALNGPIPKEIFNLNSLEDLYLESQKGNNWTCARSNGEVVDVYFSQGDPENGPNLGLEGTILDDNIANLINLRNVMIHSNNFSGTISPQISSLKLLEYLDAGANLFRSTIPDAITSLENIYHLDLAQNYLNGNLPQNVGNLKLLEIFDLSGNAGLNGSLPLSLYELSHLQQLDLHGNNFSGSISGEIGQLRELTLLSLFDNPFSGTLPSALGLCVNLEYLYIHNTNIGGSVPNEVCSLTTKSLNYTGEYWAFASDCLHGNVSAAPFIECDCCDVCCDHTTYKCVQLDSSTLSRTNQIKEKLEGQVLQRNSTFSEMDTTDPRYLALDWILNLDEMNLDSSAKNLNQRYILAVLAFSLDSQAWVATGGATSNERMEEMDYTSWLSSTDECLWYNVTCSEGDVIGLDLNEYSLIGSIPAEIGGLVSLDFISFRGNCLYGTIPPELGKLPALRFLGLAQNALSGFIPDSLFDLDVLEYLFLSYQYGNNWICLSSDGSVVDVQYAQGNSLNGVNLGLQGNILGDRIASMTYLRTLSINYNQFSGTISPQISSLGQLENLYARFNSFQSSIPGEITDLVNVINFDLALNSFSGEIPDAVGDMKKLELFSLFGNRHLNGTIPTSLYDLKNLTYLYLDGNNFSGNISDKIGQLTNLKHLTVNDNPLIGSLPNSLGSCGELEMLHIDKTNLTGTVPDEVCMLTTINLYSPYMEDEIFKADCAHDNETGVPFITCTCCDTCCDHVNNVCFANYNYSDHSQDTISTPSENTTSNAIENPFVNHTDDSRVNLFMRKFEDEILQRDAKFGDLDSEDPRNLALEWILFEDQMNLGVDSINLSQRYVLALIAFSLDSKAWGTFEASGVTRNEALGGTNNWLSSIDECSWYNVSCTGGLVTGIQLDEYSLIGEIPPEISRLDHVESLSLRKNCLYGTLPPELGNLPVTYLGIAQNAFSGFIPESFFNLTSAEYVYLSYQNGNLWNCTRSKGGVVNVYYSHGDRARGANLGLQGKIFSGKISNLSNLKTISITNNQFSGTISPDISTLTQLEYLYAGSNAIRSTIPSEISTMEKLRDLDLAQNYLTGEIPQDLGNMMSLEYFALSGNGGLTGPLPKSLFELDNLQYIYVQENALTGQIPGSIGTNQGLVDLNLGSNEFTGSMPNGLYNLTNLVILYLHENRFSGSISNKIGDLTALTTLSFYGNPFTGTVPSSLGLCEELENLYLDGTNLHGSVPEEVCSLTMKNLVPREYDALSADCYPDSETLVPFLECGCCDVCCDHVTHECVTTVME